MRIYFEAMLNTILASRESLRESYAATRDVCTSVAETPIANVCDAASSPAVPVEAALLAWH